MIYVSYEKNCTLKISLGIILSNHNDSSFQTYGESRLKPECKYHPGVPIFHEGMKFWSCCQRKTSDFQSFLNQEGCMLGEHKWKKDDVSLDIITKQSSKFTSYLR